MAVPVLNFNPYNPWDTAVQTALGTYKGIGEGRGRQLENQAAQAKLPHAEAEILASIAATNAQANHANAMAQYQNFIRNNPGYIAGGDVAQYAALQDLANKRNQQRDFDPSPQGGATFMPQQAPQNTNMMPVQEPTMQMPYQAPMVQEPAQRGERLDRWGQPIAPAPMMQPQSSPNQLQQAPAQQSPLMQGISQGLAPKDVSLTSFGQGLDPLDQRLAWMELGPAGQAVVQKNIEIQKAGQLKQNELNIEKTRNFITDAQRRSETARLAKEDLDYGHESYLRSLGDTAFGVPLNVGPLASKVPFAGGLYDEDRREADQGFGSYLQNVSQLITPAGTQQGPELLEKIGKWKISTDNEPQSELRQYRHNSLRVSRIMEEGEIANYLAGDLGFDDKQIKAFMNDYNKDHPADKPRSVNVNGKEESIEGGYLNTWPEYLQNNIYKYLTDEQLRALASGGGAY